MELELDKSRFIRRLTKLFSDALLAEKPAIINDAWRAINDEIDGFIPTVSLRSSDDTSAYVLAIRIDRVKSIEVVSPSWYDCHDLIRKGNGFYDSEHHAYYTVEQTVRLLCDLNLSENEIYLNETNDNRRLALPASTDIAFC